MDARKAMDKRFQEMVRKEGVVAPGYILGLKIQDWVSHCRQHASCNEPTLLSLSRV